MAISGQQIATKIELAMSQVLWPVKAQPSEVIIKWSQSTGVLIDVKYEEQEKVE